MPTCQYASSFRFKSTFWFWTMIFLPPNFLRCTQTKLFLYTFNEVDFKLNCAFLFFAPWALMTETDLMIWWHKLPSSDLSAFFFYLPAAGTSAATTSAFGGAASAAPFNPMMGSNGEFFSSIHFLLPSLRHDGYFVPIKNGLSCLATQFCFRLRELFLLVTTCFT